MPKKKQPLPVLPPIRDRAADTLTRKKQSNPIDKHIGSRLRFVRMTKGWSQEKLGDAVQLTFQQIQKYEKGTNRIGGSRLQQFATLLGVPPSFFFEGANEVAPLEAQPSSLAREVVLINEFMATGAGAAMAAAMVRIKRNRFRLLLVQLAEEIAAEFEPDHEPSLKET